MFGKYVIATVTNNSAGYVKGTRYKVLRDAGEYWVCHNYRLKLTFLLPKKYAQLEE